MMKVSKAKEEEEIRRLKEQFDLDRRSMENEFNALRKAKASDEQQISSLRYTIEQFSTKMREYSQVNEKCDDMESKINLATDEIERLNRVLKERNAELRDNQNKLFEAEDRSRTLEMEFNRMRNRLENESSQRTEAQSKVSQYEIQLRDVGNVSRKIVEYENKIAIINEERERLETALKAKTNELNERDRISRDLEFEVESNKRKMNNMEGRLGQLNTLTEKVIQYEVQMGRMNSQAQSF